VYSDAVALVIISAVAAISLSWFRGYPLLIGGDTNLALNLKVIDEYFYAVTASAYGGADVAKYSFLLPLGLLLKVYALSGLPFSASVFEKLMIYVIFASSGISAYLLIAIVCPKSGLVARLFGSLLYMFNFYHVYLWTDLAIYLFMIYAFFPLILGMYIKGVEERKGLSYAVVVASLWTITMTAGYGKPWILTNWLVILSFLIFHLMTVRGKGRSKKALLFTFQLAMVWIASNAIWITPLAFSFPEELGRQVIPGVSPWDLFVGNSARMIDALRLEGLPSMAGTYKNSPYFPWYGIYTSPLFIGISLLLPILAFSGILASRRDKSAVYFGILTCLFLFLVKGPNEPLGSINVLLFSRFSFDFIFRSVYSRFMGYVALGFAVLVAFGAEKVLKAKIGRKSLDVAKVLSVVLLLVVLVGVLAYPLWTGSLYDQSGVFASRRVRIPSYYYDAADWVENQPGDFNILPLPFPKAATAVFSWNNRTDGYHGSYPFRFLSSRRFLITDFGGGTGSSLADLIIRDAIADSSTLNVFNIKYIFFHRDADWQYMEGNDRWVSAAPGQIQDSLASIDGLILERSFGKIDVYRNTRWEPMHAYVLPATLLSSPSITDVEQRTSCVYTNGDDAISRFASIADVIEDAKTLELTRINPTLYKANIRTAQPFILILNDGYDEGWLLEVNGKRYEPFCVFGFANGYALNVQGNLEITLDYQPQHWFYCGALISVISTIASAGYLVYAKRAWLMHTHGAVQNRSMPCS
jgi:hypothetical protein